MLKAISFVCLLLAAVVCISVWWLLQIALPTLDGVVTIPHLYHPAVVKFDERGVPYIEASSDRDLWLIQGYVTAGDRIFQMDMLRRTAEGQLSEVFGSTCLAQDRLMRTLGFNRLAAQEAKQLPAETAANLKAYCLGVDSYLSQHVGKLPLPFVLLGYRPRLWEPQDTLAIMKYEQYQLEESWQLIDLRERVFDKIGDKLTSDLFDFNFAVAKAVPAVPVSPKPTEAPSTSSAARNDKLIALSNQLDLLPRASSSNPHPLWGSNAWNVAPALSDSRGALLSCDKHSEFTSPDKWYLCSLTGPDTHVAGATIPGVPGIIVGRNDSISWGGTSLKTGTQALYLEDFSPQFPNKYKTEHGWQNAQEIVEEIPVRFTNLFSSANELHKVLITEHGPILLKNDNTAISLAWTAFTNTNSSLTNLWKINKAQNWQQFLGAINNYSGPAQTFIYADKNGNIGLHAAGNIPYRQPQSFGKNVILSGSINNPNWQARASFNDLPSAYNPANGYSVADFQNSPPSIVNAYRARRIAAVLNAYSRGGQKIGLPEMALLQGDQFAPLSMLVKKELRQSINKAEIIDRYQLSALELIDHWDGYVKPDSPAAAIYESFLSTLTQRILVAKLGPDLAKEYMQRFPKWSYFIEQVIVHKPLEWLPPEERTYETFMITTFAESLKNLRIATRSDDASGWSWQRLHKAVFINITQKPLANFFTSVPLFSNLLNLTVNVGPIGVGGDQDTVDACNITPAIGTFEFSSDSGPTQRLLVDMSDEDKFYQTLALGQSEHILSPHRNDQLRSWLTLEPHAIAFSQSQVDKQLQHKLILTNQ